MVIKKKIREYFYFSFFTMYGYKAEVFFKKEGNTQNTEIITKLLIFLYVHRKNIHYHFSHAIK